MLQVLQSTIYEVDLDRILQSIHIYLEDLGMEEIRRRYLMTHFCYQFIIIHVGNDLVLQWMDNLDLLNFLSLRLPSMVKFYKSWS